MSAETAPHRSEAIQVVPMRREHWPAVAAIYREGIATRNATFETEVPSFERWDATHLPEHRLVALAGDEVVGWAALAAVSGRCVYRGVAENSVYVAASARGRGVGRSLLEALVGGSEAAGIWTIETGVFPENAASIALHERCGFRVVGVRERLGQMDDGTWRDVVLLERRSRAM
jgi:L-amino acid N-acyltransferase YncA